MNSLVIVTMSISQFNWVRTHHSETITLVLTAHDRDYTREAAHHRQATGPRGPLARGGGQTLEEPDRTRTPSSGVDSEGKDG